MNANLRRHVLYRVADVKVCVVIILITFKDLKKKKKIMDVLIFVAHEG